MSSFQKWSELAAKLELIDPSDAAAFDSAVMELMDLEHSLLARPVASARDMAIKLLVSSRQEDRRWGANMAALLEEARRIADT